MSNLIVGIGAVTAVFSALYLTFEPILTPAIAAILGAIK